jgi:hypothetical protein
MIDRLRAMLATTLLMWDEALRLYGRHVTLEGFLEGPGRRYDGGSNEAVASCRFGIW